MQLVHCTNNSKYAKQRDNYGILGVTDRCCVAGDIVHSVREFVQQLGWTQALETLIDNSKDHVQVCPVFIHNVPS